MPKTLTISDSAYERLEKARELKGFPSVENYLNEWRPDEEELQRRQAQVREIDAIRERLSEKYGLMPNSYDYIREDRER